MMLQQKSVVKRTHYKQIDNPVPRISRQTDLPSSPESLLRDVAFVLHATQVVRRAMEADPATCSAAS
ncbi:MAG TPA: hypothetical protein VH592_13100 [Gemmataceae bacterium]|jgi:hypothetical protein